MRLLRTSPMTFRNLSTRSTTLVVSTQPWAISARNSSKIVIPGRRSNQQPDPRPPQGAHSKEWGNYAQEWVKSAPVSSLFKRLRLKNPKKITLKLPLVLRSRAKRGVSKDAPEGAATLRTGSSFETRCCRIAPQDEGVG